MYKQLSLNIILIILDFRKTCNHIRRTVRRVDTPITIIGNTKTEGIGFDGGSDCKLNNKDSY
jgi:hypothetical protein